MTPIRKNYNQNWLPSIFNDFFDNDWMVKANATAPAINVLESDTDYKVEVAAPGMTKEDFNIHLSVVQERLIELVFVDKWCAAEFCARSVPPYVRLVPGLLSNRILFRNPCKALNGLNQFLQWIC